MNLRSISYLICIGSLANTAPAFADTQPAEQPVPATTTRPPALWELQSSVGLGGRSADFFDLHYQVEGSIARYLGRGFQGVFKASFDATGPFLGDGFTSSIVLGPRLNFSFSDQVKNDFYLFLGAGLTSRSGIRHPLLSLEVGKRISLHENVSLTPHLSLSFNPTSGEVSYAIVPLALSLSF